MNPLNSPLSSERNAQFIAMAVIAHLSKYPHDAGLFISACGEGVKQFADKQQDHANKYLNMLSDVVAANPNIKDGQLYDIKDIVATILPAWKGAGFEKELQTKFAGRFEDGKNLLKSNNEEVNDYGLGKETSAGDFKPQVKS